jgi:hypothetical protein
VRHLEGDRSFNASGVRLTVFFLSRSRYGPLIRVGIGVALVIFALVVPSASRLVLVVGALAIGSGIATGIARLKRGIPDSGMGAHSNQDAKQPDGTSSIYRELGVSSRDDAVTRATDLGLICAAAHLDDLVSRLAP